MTVHELHDALNMLPPDLLTAADRFRAAPKGKTIPWRRYAALAAMLALVLGSTLVFRQKLLPAMDMAKTESVAESPAAMAAPTVGQEAPAEDAAGSTSVTADEKVMEEEFGADHSHSFGEETENRNSTAAYCGNLEVTVDVAGERFSLSGSDAVKITDILRHLDYDPDQVCRCMAEFTVDMETLTGIEVNLTEGFARCERGQAALTQQQAATLREIIDSLQ